MEQKLKRIFTEAEHERHALIELIRQKCKGNVPQPPLNKWSITQILSHLMMSERMSFQYMKKKYLGINEAPESGLLQELKLQLLIVSQRLPIKYKAPAVLGEGEPPEITLAEAETQWNALREEIASFLEKFDDKTVKKNVYKHPIAGRLNVIQAIRFFQEHMRHHVPQIKRQLS